jgi:hypothetical protein
MIFCKRIWSFRRDGKQVFPYKGRQGDKKGLFSVNLTSDNKNFTGYTEQQLINAIRAGKFATKGRIRMLPIDRSPRDQANAYAPEFFEGKPVRNIPAKKADISGLPAKGSDAIADIEAVADLVLLRETQRQAIVKSRIGQGLFRDRLVQYWNAACAVTRCPILAILKASHIKPWRTSDNKERLDVFNGLPLLPNLDAALDQGLLSFRDDGSILIAPGLDRHACAVLGINSKLRLFRVDKRHYPYLAYHRSAVFRKI